MALFSRSFIRKRAIAAATAFLVSMASLALGPQPASMSHSPLLATVQKNPAWGRALAETQRTQAERTPIQLCNWRMHAVKDTVKSAPLPPLG